MERAILDRREMQYLYNAGDKYHLMDTNLQQLALTAER